MSNLKPCPFCGGEAFAHILGNEISKGYYIACDECGAKTKVFGYEAEAIEAWNRAIGAKDINVPDKYEYHIDHTDCIWYWNGKGKCPSTCSQYRDGWNDAMNYIYKDGKGYSPYRRGE